MTKPIRRVIAAAALLLAFPRPAPAQTGGTGRLAGIDAEALVRAVGAEMASGATGATEPHKPTPVVSDSTLNYDFEERNFRWEPIRRKTKRSKGSGVTPADRVEQGLIKYIVIHSAGGSDEGAITHLLKRNTAAHFIVGQFGEVTQMVQIKDVANHVKNGEIDAQSVGIETETGHLKAPQHRPEDWDPGTRWRMLSSIAKLVRAISKMTGVPMDAQHVIGHVEADRGIKGAHPDPGPYYYNQTYKALDERFPGKGVTPRDFLLRLANDGTPPTVQIQEDDGKTRLVASDVERLGLERVFLELMGPEGKALATVFAHDARQTMNPKSAQYGLPPEKVSVPLPDAPGSYRLLAVDLVGNYTTGRFQIVPSQPAALTVSKD